MNKKLMAVAIAGALGSPALVFAQASTVQLYGQIQIEYASQDAGGSGSTAAASKPTRDALINTTSYWGIKGEEALGGGLSAWFQMEQNMPINGTSNAATAVNNPNQTTALGGGNLNGNVAGSATSGVSPGLTCDRNCAIGLKGGFGNFYFGNWYTPKFIASLGAQLPAGATSPQGWAQIMGNAQATGNNITQTTSFARRQENSLNFESPNFGGFTINAAMSASNEKTAGNTVAGTAAVGATVVPVSAAGTCAAGTTAVVNGGVTVACSVPAVAAGAPIAVPGLTPRMWGLAGRYDNGPLFVSLGYERHNDYNPAAAIPTVTGPATATGLSANYKGGNDTGWELRASYLIGGVFKLIAGYERLSYTTTSGGPLGTTNLDHNSWLIAGDWRIAGPHNLRAMYERGQSTSGTFVGTVGNYIGNGGAGSTGSNLWTLEYAYDFSKRTSLYLDYARMSNDAFATTALNTFATPNAGATQTNYGVGLRHKF